MSNILNEKPPKQSIKEKFTNYFLGEDTWENITTIGWTASILGWVILFPYLNFWSLLIPVVFYFIQREISHSREAQKYKFSKFNFGKIRVWEDANYNYETYVAFKNTDVYPFEIKPEVKSRIFVKSKKNREALIIEVKKKGEKIKELNDELDKLQVELKNNQSKKEKKQEELTNKKNSEEDEEKDDDEEFTTDHEENLEIEEKIESVMEQINNIEDNDIVDNEEEEIRITTKLFETISKFFNRYKFYIVKKEWSNSIKEPKIMFICPTDFWSCFSFPSRESRYKTFSVPFGRRADFSVFDYGTHNNCRIFRVTECNYQISQMDLENSKPELFKMDHVDAEILVTSSEYGKLLEEYQVLKLDNMKLEGQLKSVTDHNKLTTKKLLTQNLDNQKLNTRVKKYNPTLQNPPKNLYLITIIGWIIALILIIIVLKTFFW